MDDHDESCLAGPGCCKDCGHLPEDHLGGEEAVVRERQNVYVTAFPCGVDGCRCKEFVGRWADLPPFTLWPLDVFPGTIGLHSAAMSGHLKPGLPVYSPRCQTDMVPEWKRGYVLGLVKDWCVKDNEIRVTYCVHEDGRSYERETAAVFLWTPAPWV